VRVIRETGILSEFPSKTEGDLYLWVLDHQRYLVEEGEALQPPEDAARNFKDALKHKRARKPRSDKGLKRKKR
ncbi:MAG: hypothetical protein ACM3PS_17060, partial [Syntrophothermus sp.]